MKMPRSSPWTTGCTTYTPAITSDSWTSANASLLGEVDGRVNRSSRRSAHVAQRARLQRLHARSTESILHLALVALQVEEHEAAVRAHDRALAGGGLHLGDDLLRPVRIPARVDPEAVEADRGDG